MSKQLTNTQTSASDEAQSYMPDDAQDDGRQVISVEAQQRRDIRTHAIPRPLTPSQVQQEENKRRVLMLLGRFGIVDTHFTAYVAFNGYKQAYEMARRTLNLLREARYIDRRTGVHGSSVFVLTNQGAHEASKIFGREIQSGIHLRTPSSPTWLHRLLGSYYLFHYAAYLDQRGVEYDYLCERELEQRGGRDAIDSKSIVGKRRPDALIMEINGDHREAIWIEVERGLKTFQRFDDQLSSLLPMFGKNIAPKQIPVLILREVHYVADPGAVDLVDLGGAIRKVVERKNRPDLLDRITVFRANVKRPYCVEDLSGLCASAIPITAPDAPHFESYDKALEQEFNLGLVIDGRRKQGD